MAKVKVDLAKQGARGLEIDQSRYLPDSRGRVDIEDPKHLALLQRVPPDGGVSFESNTGFAETKLAERYCVPCRFVGWKWQAECPRCAGPMVDYTANPAGLV